MKELVNVNVPKPKGVEEVKAPEEKKRTVGERIIEAEEDALVHEATKKAHGLGEGSGGQEPSIQTQIVTNAMNMQTKAIENMDKRAGVLEGEIKIANKAASDMQFQLLQQQLTILQEAQQKSNEAAKEAQAAGAPKDAFGYYIQVRDHLEELVKKVTPSKEEAAAATQKPGMSDATQIRLKELELQQQQVLAQITADNTRAREQFQLQMAEFTDNKEIRHLEYQDKKHFREEGLHGVTDLVEAIGAGVSQKGGPAGVTTAKPEAEEAEAGAYISSFKCSVCGGEVPVGEGQTVAQCPNPECGASFQIKAKE